MLAPMTATHGIPDQASFEAGQATIEQRETARVEALLQVCKLVATDQLTSADGIELILALQHDLADDGERQHIVRQGLFILALRWHQLPVDAREVVLAGLGIDWPAIRSTWAEFVTAVAVGATKNHGRYTMLRRVLVTAVTQLNEETPTDD
jgi:hypothetical protein